jgi:quercetin dioxygenase-like cupin family protein
LQHRRLTTELRDQAALYALEMLPPEEIRAFEEHLREGCALCLTEVRLFRETSSQLAHAAPPVKPARDLTRELRARISASDTSSVQVWKKWKADIPAALHVVRSGEGTWEPTAAEGVTVKRLYVDPSNDTGAMLIRMAPGSSYPSHRHGGPEHCLVLEGDVRAGGVVLDAGDYQCAAHDSVHEPTHTVNGCLLLIVSSLQDRLLP